MRMRYIFTCVIFNIHNNLVTELLSLPFYRWKKQAKICVQEQSLFHLKPHTFPLSCWSPIVNHESTVEIIIHRKDNENLMFSKIFKTFFYRRCIQHWKQKSPNIPSNYFHILKQACELFIWIIWNCETRICKLT